ncbi:hypothetical protein GCM10009786_27220 [Leucobacter alluvii]|uniref:Uncharacterized protein n=1 Tax=Leucobacter alluvii TaxID=340321 RepID=A0ABN3B8D7_9MICO
MRFGSPGGACGLAREGRPIRDPTLEVRGGRDGATRWLLGERFVHPMQQERGSGGQSLDSMTIELVDSVAASGSR